MELIVKMIIALIVYDILGWGLVLLLPWKRWDRKMENPPTPPLRKSFKEKLAEKESGYEYLKKQKTKEYNDKVDEIANNPPKETGT